MEMIVNKKQEIGNQGDTVRSDCFVSLILLQEGGRQISLHSKVEALYGDSIRKLADEVLQFFGIEHCSLTINDTGALPLVLAARIEAAIKKLMQTDKEYLPEILPQNTSETAANQYRFSRLYLPGNNPKLMINAGIHQPNGIILDLEDAVAFDKKYEARFLVRNALRAIDFYGAERMVRINQIPAGLDDLDYIVPHPVNLILVPKCESADQIKQVNEKIKAIQSKNGQSRDIWLMPIIESALGVIKAYEIASAAPNVVALAIGLEDFTADLGTQRTNEGRESYLARTQLVLACKAAGIQAIDSVFSDISDMEALKANVLDAKALGFDGMGCIHPRQVKVVKENFAPNAKEIEKAQKIVHAFILATEKGLGVVSLGSKMIDPPVVKRAERTINLALSMGIIEENWGDAFLVENK